jgi:outer membrane receptor protein involved in Fe transport
VWQVPKHTAGASVSLTASSSTTVAGGLTYVGSRTFLDSFGYISCIGGTAPCRNTTFLPDRSYLIVYPGFIKANLTATQQFTPLIAVFVSVDNLTNNQAFEYSNLEPVVGRVTTIGTQLRF